MLAYRQAYSAAMQSLAHNGLTMAEARAQYSQACENAAHNMWSQVAIDNARATYAAKSEQIARNGWTRQWVNEQILKRATAECDYYRAAAGLPADPLEKQPDKGFWGNAWDTVTGFAGAVKDFAVGIYDMSLYSLIFTPDRFVDKWDSMVSGFTAGVQENGWWAQLNMTLNPMYYVYEAGGAAYDAFQTGDWHGVGEGIFQVPLALAGAALIVVPTAGLIVNAGKAVVARLASVTETAALMESMPALITEAAARANAAQLTEYFGGVNAARTQIAAAEASVAAAEASQTGILGASRLTAVEQATAARLQAMPEFAGRTLRESPHVGAEYIDDLGRTYDAVGAPAASAFWNEQEFLGAIERHILKSNDFTVVDLTGFTPGQIAVVARYVDSLSREAQATIVRIGF
ncbi:MAG: hypothetical protein JW722_00400 [Demequinaceae bacterium]|nr:hypothetical protein [Demequinaceae bacterium]